MARRQLLDDCVYLTSLYSRTRIARAVVWRQLATTSAFVLFILPKRALARPHRARIKRTYIMTLLLCATFSRIPTVIYTQ